MHLLFQIIIVGDKEAEDTKALLSCVHSHFLPNKVLLVVPGKNKDGHQKSTFLSEKLEVLESLSCVGGKATAYVCENYTCQLPVTSVEELDELLEA